MHGQPSFLEGSHATHDMVSGPIARGELEYKRQLGNLVFQMWKF
jgi:hypothetical protein